MSIGSIKYYFPTVKLVYLVLFILYILQDSSELTYKEGIVQVGFILIFMSIVVCYEIMDKKHVMILLLEIVMVMILIKIFKAEYSMIIPIIVLDFIIYFKLSKHFYFIVLLGLKIYDGEFMIYLIASISWGIIYFQHYSVIDQYDKTLRNFIDNELNLKSAMRSEKFRHKDNVEKYRLSSENKILEDRNRISQALHDNIGHSINGSVYLLEACKILIEKDPIESKRLIQAIIDSLRKSLDEIRAILRAEKPNNGELALLQLKKLCDNFNEKYNIKTKLEYSGEVEDIPEYIWEIILDNTIEAFTNSLKYSGCKNINVKVVALNKLVRCSISDDGKGCENLKEGMGISGIRERVKKVGGNIDVNSKIGFEINMLLPRY